SFTKSYRIYLLILPQANIMAAADRAETTASLFSTLSSQLQTRIAAATSGNVSTLNASLSDMNAKIADANFQAQAAIETLTPLKPGNGDKTVFASNQTTLKDARSKIKTAVADLVGARQDARSIVQGLKIRINASANAGNK